jgi:Tfp pilus assembly PilM family ATPase
VLDYTPLPEWVRRSSEKTVPVLVFSASREVVEGILKKTERLGLRVERLVTPACVLAQQVARSEPETRHLMVATSEEATSISVVQDGHVLLERIIPWSLGRLVDRLRGELDLEERQSRALLARWDLPQVPGRQDERQAAESDTRATDEPDGWGTRQPDERASKEPDAQDAQQLGQRHVGKSELAGKGVLDGAHSEHQEEWDPDELDQQAAVGELPFEGAVREVLAPAFQELTNEAVGCLGYCASFLKHAPTSAVVLTGPLSNQTLLRNSLEAELGLPVRGPREGLLLPGLDGESEGAAFATAACCALWSEGKTP